MYKLHRIDFRSVSDRSITSNSLGQYSQPYAVVVIISLQMMKTLGIQVKGEEF